MWYLVVKFTLCKLVQGFLPNRQNFAIHTPNKELTLKPHSQSPDEEYETLYQLDVGNIYWWQVMDTAVYFKLYYCMCVLSGELGYNLTGFDEGRKV